jgi:hypothetical protein
MSNPPAVVLARQHSLQYQPLCKKIRSEPASTIDQMPINRGTHHKRWSVGSNSEYALFTQPKMPCGSSMANSPIAMKNRQAPAIWRLAGRKNQAIQNSAPTTVRNLSMASHDYANNPLTMQAANKA